MCLFHPELESKGICVMFYLACALLSQLFLLTLFLLLTLLHISPFSLPLPTSTQPLPPLPSAQSSFLKK